ncbi:MucR family transcriptional regulator [Ahrensia sp. R2A130]|uniref:MucR family transcriptional regulator n=1 Tax=Ahrensia sp. R2A130 TaxID=744979 RepID=UPI0001E0E0D3|nr:MucR family transcriptional regulator [Ahrensia sp. R2A130]EFL88939.1 transcriptional regulatory protein MucR [Ahrensia sp. R2A130]
MENYEVEDDSVMLGLTTEVVCAYVGNNPIAASDLAGLIKEVHGALHGLQAPAPEPEPEKPVPAVSIRKSLKDDYLICLEDGKKFKSLKRHLKTHYDLSPEQYREKWGLPSDYPMVAPNYAAERSRLAKKMGLGRKAS